MSNKVNDDIIAAALNNPLRKKYHLNILFGDIDKNPNVKGFNRWCDSENHQLDKDLEILYEHHKKDYKNYGFATGHEGLADLDFDWLWVYLRAKEHFGDRLDTFTTKTPNGGIRVLLFTDSIKNPEKYKESLKVEVHFKKYVACYGEAKRDDRSIGKYEIIVDTEIRKDDTLAKDLMVFLSELKERYKFLSYPCIKAKLPHKKNHLTHEQRLAISNFMIQSGIPIPEAAEFFSICPDYDKSISEYQVADTAQRIKDEKLNYPTCESLLTAFDFDKDQCKGCPRKNEFKVSDGIGDKNQYPEMDLKDILLINKKQNYKSLELTLPTDHFIIEYVKWLSSISDGYKEYHVIGALWILSTLVSRKVVLKLKQGDVRPNLWMFIFGKSTTSRKSTSVNRSREMYEIATDVTLYNEDYSIEGYLETLSLNPVLANVRDEAAGLMAKFHKKYNEGIFELECQLYDGQNVKKTLAGGKAKVPKTYEVKNPYITKLYASTPDNFARYMTVDDFLCGYGFRFLYANPNYHHSRKPLTKKTPEDIKAWAQILETIKTIHQQLESIPIEKEFDIEDEAMQFYDNSMRALEDYGERTNNDMLNSAIGRAQAYILKIAMLLELGKKEMSFTIHLDTMQIASNMIINYFLPATMEIIDRLQEDAKNNQIERITNVIRRLGGAVEHSKALHDSKMKSKDFAECIATMHESESIDIIVDAKSKKRGSCGLRSECI